jgi:hypothetical protein
MNNGLYSTHNLTRLHHHFKNSGYMKMPLFNIELDLCVPGKAVLTLFFHGGSDSEKNEKNEFEFHNYCT